MVIIHTAALGTVIINMTAFLVMATRWQTGSKKYMDILTPPNQTCESLTFGVMFLNINNNLQTRLKSNFSYLSKDQQLLVGDLQVFSAQL